MMDEVWQYGLGGGLESSLQDDGDGDQEDVLESVSSEGLSGQLPLRFEKVH